ncbi:hypothetical protein F750_5228 [Streptomyces sp. PAMC 26508]|nr:hypothetical protein F750_5228 [Streptomyces sp. PAMC 26508]
MTRTVKAGRSLVRQLVKRRFISGGRVASTVRQTACGLRECDEGPHRVNGAGPHWFRPLLPYC